MYRYDYSDGTSSLHTSADTTPTPPTVVAKKQVSGDTVSTVAGVLKTAIHVAGGLRALQNGLSFLSGVLPWTDVP